MKSLLFALGLLLSTALLAQTTVSPISNDYVVSNPERDTLYILKSQVGTWLQITWRYIKEANRDGKNPTIIMTSDLEAIRRKYNYSILKLTDACAN
jgi:hypothetical protein